MNNTSISRPRLQQELTEMALASSLPPLCCSVVRGDDILTWTVTMFGPPDTVYEGGAFKIRVEIPESYPFKPPKVRFLTSIYHCNIDSTGNVCLDILDEFWSPSMHISSVLVAVSSLMSECHPEDPVVGNIAKLYLSNREEHDRLAREHTKEFAIPKTRRHVPPANQGDGPSSENA